MSIASALWGKIEAQLPATLQKARLLGMGIPVGKSSKVYYVDPVNGLDTNSGRSVESPLLTLAAAEDKCVSGQHDTVILLASATANALAATLAWDKDYTHLIGWGCDLPGVGQRCRVTGSAALDLPTLITVSGAGCQFKNIQFFNGSDLVSSTSGAVTVTGGRNSFENCFFAGMGHATSAGNASGFSLKVSGDECTFKRCSIGLGSILRSAANTELLLSGECNRLKFIDCEFLSWCNTAGKFLVKLDSTAVPYTLQFENCLFNNFCSNNGATGTALSNAISDAATPYHQIILKGDNPLVGVTGYADTVTYIFSAAPAPNAGYGVSVNPTT